MASPKSVIIRISVRGDYNQYNHYFGIRGFRTEPHGNDLEGCVLILMK
jgi:hypothetical protein